MDANVSGCGGRSTKREKVASSAPGRISGFDASLWRHIPSSDQFALLKQNAKYELCCGIQVHEEGQWTGCMLELCWQHDEEGRPPEKAAATAEQS